MKALFGRKFYNIEDLRYATKRANKSKTNGTSYIATKEVELESKDYKGLTDDLLEDQTWIEDFDGGYTEKGEVKCIRVINKDTGEKLLINPEGYTYPRYTALEN